MTQQQYRRFVGGISFLIICLSFLFVTHPVSATAQTGVMIALYTYPDSTWTAVAQAKAAHPSVPVVAIINPNNGPGSSRDANYVSGIQQLHAAGVVVIGYDATGYTSRGISAVESDINTWKSLYSIDGIFFDEMSNVAGDENFYSTVSQYAKSHGYTMTVGNPGTDTLSSYIGTVDNLMIYENPGLPALSALQGWHTNYDKSNFSMIAFGVSSLSQSFITSTSNYVGYLYITNDVLPNPYDTVPSYFATEVADLDTGVSATVSQPPTGLITTTVSSSQINLSWITPSNNGGSAIIGYEIDRSTNGGSTWSALVANTASTVTTYSNTGLAPNTTYTYRVSAINSVGTSSPSGISTATTGSTATVPQPPTNLVASAFSSSQINLNWTAGANGGSTITGYKVDRSTDGGTTWTTIISNTGSTTTTYSNTGLAPNITYTYRVSAINSVGTSSVSNTTSATTNTSTTNGGIALRNTMSISGTTTSSNQITLSNFNASVGNSRLLVVGISANNNDVASVTFGGISLKNNVRSFYNNDAELWYLKNPSGIGNVVVTMNGPTQAIVGAYSLSGVNQTTPIQTHVAKHNTTPSSPKISLTTKYANNWILDLPSIYGGSTLSNPTCTQHWDVNIQNQITGASSSVVASTPGTTSCGWTASHGELWDDVVIEINAIR